MRFFEGTVLEKRALTSAVRHVVLRLDHGDIFRFLPGQFIQFVLDPRTLRMFSIASVPSNLPLIELCVDITPGGRGSQFIESLSEGQRVSFRGPFGVFTVPAQETRPLEFVATGAGIAPIRSMINAALEASGSDSRSLTLTFGNRDRTDVLYHDEWVRLHERVPWFHYLPTLSGASDSWTGARGRVTDAMRERAREMPGRVFFLCGSPAMVDDMRRLLSDTGVGDADVHFEKFF